MDSKKNILITGGTGLIGRRLSELLTRNNYSIRLLSRNPQKNSRHPSFYWDPINRELDVKALDDIHAIIHLAGAPIVDQKWTRAYQDLIIRSRVDGVLLLAEYLQERDHSVQQFISSSGIGYYGAQTQEHIYTEEDGSYTDFVSMVCRVWEEVGAAMEQANIPTAYLRTGVVLAEEGGALPKLAAPVKWGLAAALGSGKQWMPWIHIDDLCAMYLHVLQNDLKGIYNACTDDHQSNHSFTKALAQQMKRPYFMPNVPAFAMKWFLGKRADLLLEGSRCSAEKIKDSGFSFQFENLDTALNDLL